MLYPSIYPIYNDNIYERLVFEALDKLNKKDFDVFFTQRFSGFKALEQSQYEIDFIIADLRNGTFNGMLLLEVKGGLIKYDAFSKIWYQGSRVMEKDPVQQIQSAMSSLVYRFNTILQHVPVGWALVFPSGNNNEFLGTDFHVKRILTEKHLSVIEQSISEAIESIRNQKDQEHRKGTGLDDYIKLKRYLLNGLNIVSTLSGEINKQEKTYIALSENQNFILECLRKNTHLIIYGCAGSGKTLLAIQKAKKMAEEGKKVLFLCFNRLPALMIGETLSENSIKVNSFLSQCEEWIQEVDSDWLKKNDNKKDQEYFEKRLPNKAAEVLLGRTLDFNTLIIDEGQDFSPEWLEMLEKAVPINSEVLYFWDPGQNIFDKNLQWIEDKKYTKVILDKNIRSTQNIINHLQPYSNIEIRSDKYIPTGSEITQLYFENDQELKAHIENCITFLNQEEKVPLQDIMIIPTSNSVFEQFIYNHPFTKFNFCKYNRDHINKHNGIRYSNIYTVKGLEFSVVIIILFGELNIEAKKELYYTMCSRAKSKLIILNKLN